MAIESEKSKSKVDFANYKVKSLSGKILNLSQKVRLFIESEKSK